MHHLDTLAMPRPGATSRLLRALEEEHEARVGGTPGSGRTTLAHQVARAWTGPAVLVDTKALLDPDPATIRREAAQALGRPGRDTLTIVDGPADAAVLDALRDAFPGALLQIHDGPIVPEDIPETTARTFLRRRAMPTLWDEDALEEIARLAAGRPDALQRLGQACLHRAHNAITHQDALDAAVHVAHNPPTAFATALSRLSPARMALLKAIARYPDETPTQWAARAGVPQRSAMVHLGRLVTEHGLLARPDRGRYRLTSPLLALHLRVVYASPVRVLSTARQ